MFNEQTSTEVSLPAVYFSSLGESQFIVDTFNTTDIFLHFNYIMSTLNNCTS